MNPDERDAIIAGWWEHHQLSNGTRVERKALASGHPSRAVEAHEKGR